MGSLVAARRRYQPDTEKATNTRTSVIHRNGVSGVTGARNYVMLILKLGCTNHNPQVCPLQPSHNGAGPHGATGVRVRLSIRTLSDSR